MRLLHLFDSPVIFFLIIQLLLMATVCLPIKPLNVYVNLESSRQQTNRILKMCPRTFAFLCGFFFYNVFFLFVSFYPVSLFLSCFFLSFFLSTSLYIAFFYISLLQPEHMSVFSYFFLCSGAIFTLFLLLNQYD